MWIIPKTLSHFVPDTEGLNLELDERAWILEQSAMLRSKPSLKQTWLRRLKKGGWITPLSTRILKPSLHQSFEEKYTESLEDIPVSPSVQRESEKEKKTQDTYGRISESTPGQLDLFGAFRERSEVTHTMGLWRVLSDLEEDGYRTEWGLFSAEETGAPHQRIRCFILAKLPDTCGEGLQGDEFGGTRSPQVEGIQGTHEPTSELHQVRNGQLGDPASLRPRGGCENREGEQSEVLGTGLESDGELAHPASREPWQSQARYGGQDTSGGSEEELVNANNSRSEECSLSRKEGRTPERFDATRPSAEELEDSARIDGKQSHGETDQVGRACEEDRGSSDVRGTKWPSRPGEEQYEWEEPRVVADSKHSKRRADKGLPTRDERRERSPRDDARSVQGVITETQSELGGAVDGTRSGVDPIANRVDRLRLLGNGVVPQTAELAWRTLWKQLNDKEDK